MPPTPKDTRTDDDRIRHLEMCMVIDALHLRVVRPGTVPLRISVLCKTYEEDTFFSLCAAFHYESYYLEFLNLIKEKSDGSET